MPKIVLSLEGYWVGKELYEGDGYISFDEVCHNVSIKRVAVVSMEEILFDIQEHMRISASEHSDMDILKTLAHELCNHSKYDMIYCIDRKAPLGVRKILPS